MMVMAIKHDNLQGSLSITRPRGGNTERIEIAVFDKSSGVEFVTVRIEPANFAEAIVGLAHVECYFDLRPELVGKYHEYKEEFVPFGDTRPHYPKPGLARENIAGPLLAPFEVDGWKGRVDDLFNHHRSNQQGARVTFTRYVEAPTASD